MANEPIPAWPTQEQYDAAWKGRESDLTGYYRDATFAALARLRVAVECMTDVQRILVDKDIAHREAVGIYNVLVAIGEVPKE